MGTPEDAAATQLRNIASKTGKSVAERAAAVAASGRASHGDNPELAEGERRAWLRRCQCAGLCCAGAGRGIAA